MKRLRLLVGSGAILVAGCATLGSGSIAQAAPVTLTLYNGQHPQTTAALIAAFEKKTGIQVAERDNDEDAIANQIVTEGSHSPADVVFTENSPVLEFLQERRLLAPISSSTLADVASRYSSPKREWIGVSARVSVMIYNTKLIKPAQLPKSIMDLADAKWKGKLGIAPSETDFQPIVTSIATARGQSAALKWLQAIKTNAGGDTYASNETLVAKVNSGAATFAVINQYYWYRLRAELGSAKINSAITYFAPHDLGYLIDVSGAGVLSSTKHLAAAQQFVAFLVSKQGQEIVAKSDSFEYPIGSGVKTVQPETPFAALKPRPLTIAQLGDGQFAISLLSKAGLI